MTILLDGPLSIRGGHTGRHTLLLTNLSQQDISVSTNGYLTASIVNSATGATVGGYAGAQPAPLILFTAAPGQTTRIPLLVSTASFEPELGYSVPTGRWHLIAHLNLSDGRRLITPPLDVSITRKDS